MVIMRGKNKLYRWLLALGILIGSASVASAYAQATAPAAWRTTPTLSTDMQLSYQFRSTSAYTPTVNVTVYTPGCSSPASLGPKRAKKDIWDDEPDEEEIAVVNTPVGEPLILLIFAILYIFWNLFAYIRKKQYLCSRKGFR